MKKIFERLFKPLAKMDSFTKLWTNRILWLSCLWITACIVLSAIGKENMEDFAIALITGVIGVFVAYSIKSFKGKKEEENLKYQREKDGLTAEEREGENE